MNSKLRADCFKCNLLLLYLSFGPIIIGDWGSVVVKALRYKLEGLGIDSPCRRVFFRGL
jgi:hypothetical protein